MNDRKIELLITNIRNIVGGRILINCDGKFHIREVLNVVHNLGMDSDVDVEYDTRIIASGNTLREALKKALRKLNG